MPSLPDKGAYLWQWYRELDGDYSAVNMKAYFDLHDIEPENWELDALKVLGRIGRSEPKKPSK